MRIESTDLFGLVAGPQDKPADADAEEWPIMWIPQGRRVRVNGAYLGAQADVAAADTNYDTITIRRSSDDAVVATLLSGPSATGTDIDGGDFVAMTVDDDYAEIEADGDDVSLYLGFEAVGTGLAIEGLVVALDVEFLPDGDVT